MKVKLQLRGGAWYHVDWIVKCAYRYRHAPGGRGHYVGFRCCFSPLFVKINKER